MEITVTVKINNKPNSDKSISNKEVFKGRLEEFDKDSFSEKVDSLVTETFENFKKVTVKKEGE